ncbi:MAG: endonuclease/exonuclease/phosphatase family protein [Melioribacteraceae bacterium]|nr:endonuclease/exonuclease/phosphatase family protein [Melioribacteraceae bacterium]
MKIIIVLVVFSTILYSQSNQILIDENFDDWNNIETFIEDPVDDLSLGIDFLKLWVTNDAKYLYIRIDIDQEINLQNDPLFSLNIDLDNNLETGLHVLDMGSDILYIFGERHISTFGDNGRFVFPAEIGFVFAPTVSSTSFEMAISLEAMIDGESLFTSENIKIAFMSTEEEGDIVPNDQAYNYKIDFSAGTNYPSYSLQKNSNTDFRLLTYNVLFDYMFHPDVEDEHRRILNAIKPDIIAFQEIFNHWSFQIKDKIEDFLPSGENEQWYCARIEDLDTNDVFKSDLALVSRYPILDIFAIPGHDPSSKENSAFLIDLPNNEEHLLIFNIHPPAGDQIEERTGDLDRIMAFLKDAKSPGGDITISQNSPFIITGDFNLVRYAYQRDIVLLGDIQDNITFGEDFDPDWDGTPFADAKPYATNTPFVFTWTWDAERFAPGRLDYVVYSDYTLNLENSFTLFTRALPSDTLEFYNLEKEDVNTVSDHLPVVADFSINSSVDVDFQEIEIIKELNLEQNFPNPFNPTTRITYVIPKSSFVKLNVYNILGQNVYELVNSYQAAGEFTVEFDGSSLSSGVYLYRLESEGYCVTKKMILLR